MFEIEEYMLILTKWKKPPRTLYKFNWIVLQEFNLIQSCWFKIQIFYIVVLSQNRVVNFNKLEYLINGVYFGITQILLIKLSLNNNIRFITVFLNIFFKTKNNCF